MTTTTATTTAGTVRQVSKVSDYPRVDSVSVRVVVVVALRSSLVCGSEAPPPAPPKEPRARTAPELRLARIAVCGVT